MRRSGATGSALTRLLAPITVREFFADYYEKKPLLIRRRAPSYFGDLLTLADVDRVLTTGHLRPGQIDVVNAGAAEPIKGKDFATPSGVVDPARVAGLFANGATIIFQRLNHSVPRLAEFCAGLEAEFTQPFQMNVYLTPPRSQGFKRHYDTHDVFVIQVIGSKQWKLYGTPVELPLAGHSFDSDKQDAGPLSRSFRLKQGDVLYVPRGLVHDAVSTGETSLHITVGVLSYTWADMMADTVSAVCRSDLRFRRSLPAGFAHATFNATARGPISTR